MAKYFIDGSYVRISKDADLDIHDSLPVGTYSVGATQAGFHLDRIDDFTLPEKIYGNVDNSCERILDTFASRPRGTGVHLDGVKGSGKTLLVKQLSLRGMERGLPTIVINTPFAGESFNDFIQSIDCPCIIIFDEFEKVYNNEKQNEILTLFDGVYPTKKLFVITTNDSNRVSSYLKNRPGRMYYKLSYEALDPQMVLELLEDTLKDKTQLDSVLRYTKIFSFINFDMLSAIIEEMNRYGETLKEVLSVLNIQGEVSKYEKYDFNIKVGTFVFPLFSNTGYDVNTFTYSISNEHLYERYITATSDPKEEYVDFDDAPPQLEIGGVMVDMSSFIETDFSANDLDRYDEENNQFIYKFMLAGAETEVIVKRKEYNAVNNPLI